MCETIWDIRLPWLLGLTASLWRKMIIKAGKQDSEPSGVRTQRCQKVPLFYCSSFFVFCCIFFVMCSMFLFSCSLLFFSGFVSLSRDTAASLEISAEVSCIRRKPWDLARRLVFPLKTYEHLLRALLEVEMFDFCQISTLPTIPQDLRANLGIFQPFSPNRYTSLIF